MVGVQRLVIAGSPPQRRQSASQLRNFPSPKHLALGCKSEMIASIAMRLVGYESSDYPLERVVSRKDG